MNQRTDGSHTIDAAMDRAELTEEEAYFVLRFAGHVGYDEAMKRLKGNPLKRLRKWFVWFGGWECPELLQWDRGRKPFEMFGECGGKRYLRGPWPLSLFGHRITCFGKWGQIKIGRGYLTFANTYADSWPNRIYWSPDGTDYHPRARMFWRRQSVRRGEI